MIFRKKHMQQLTGAWLPFADAASDGLPLRQLLPWLLAVIHAGSRFRRMIWKVLAQFLTCGLMCPNNWCAILKLI